LLIMIGNKVISMINKMRINKKLLTQLFSKKNLKIVVLVALLKNHLFDVVKCNSLFGLPDFKGALSLYGIRSNYILKSTY
jgi:hypothetical protein